jgi:hypothetical protein
VDTKGSDMRSGLLSDGFGNFRQELGYERHRRKRFERRIGFSP